MRGIFNIQETMTQGEIDGLANGIARFVEDGGNADIQFPATFTVDMALNSMRRISRLLRGRNTATEVRNACLEEIELMNRQPRQKADVLNALAVCEFVIAEIEGK